MIERVAGGKALPAEVLQQLVAKTDGVPLFVEELTKMVLESGLLQESGRALRADRSSAPAGDSVHAARLAHGAAGSPGRGQEVAQLGATLGREFSYELLQAVSPLRRGNVAAGLRAVGGSRTALPARRAAAGPLPLQACPDSGCRLSVIAQEHPAAVPPADCAGVGGPVSRDQPRRSPNCWRITTRRPVSVAQAIPYWQRAGQRAHRALGQCGSDQPPHQGAGVARDPAGHSRAHPARTARCSSPLGVALMATKGCGAGSRRSLRPGARAVPAGGGNSAALPGAVGTVVLLSVRGGVPDGPGAGGAAPAPGPAAHKIRRSSWRPTTRWGAPCSCWESLPSPERTWSRALPSTTPSSTAPLPSSMGQDPGVGA